MLVNTLFFIPGRVRRQYIALNKTEYDGRRVWAVSYPVRLYLLSSDKDMHIHMSVIDLDERILIFIFMHWQRYSLM